MCRHAREIGNGGLGGGYRLRDVLPAGRDRPRAYAGAEGAVEPPVSLQVRRPLPAAAADGAGMAKADAMPRAR